MGFRPEDRDAARIMSWMDGAAHDRVRRLVAHAFSARSIEQMRPKIKAIADTLLNEVDPREPFELVTSYATSLPTLVIAAMLGIGDMDLVRFKAWADDLQLMLVADKSDEQVQRMVAAVAGLDSLVAREVDQRRTRPRDDLISTLLAAGSEGDRLSETEIVQNTRLLLAAGNITTSDLIANGTVLLLRHGDALADLRADKSLWPAAVEEILRYDAPVTLANRQTLDDREVGGCPVEAGQVIAAILASANHDPALHQDPARFDIFRKDQRHFSFGGGQHFCLGASLARLEAQIALQSLFARFPALRLDPDHSVLHNSHPMFNGYTSVWLKADS